MRDGLKGMSKPATPEELNYKTIQVDLEVIEDNEIRVRFSEDPGTEVRQQLREIDFTFKRREVHWQAPYSQRRYNKTRTILENANDLNF